MVGEERKDEKVPLDVAISQPEDYKKNTKFDCSVIKFILILFIEDIFFRNILSSSFCIALIRPTPTSS